LMIFMPLERLKNAIDSYWARSKSFRLLMIATFFLLTASMAFLLWYVLRSYLFSTFILLSVLLIVAFKKGYGKRR